MILEQSAAAFCPDVKVLATGSSTLGASSRVFVLNEILAQTQSCAVGYWRDKQGYDVVFIW